MKKNKITDKFVDVESAGLAASRGLGFEESGLDDTAKNRELFRIIQAETQKMFRDGTDVDVSF